MNDSESILDLLDKVIGYADNQPLILNHLTVLRSRTEALVVERDQLEADTKDQTLAKEIDRLSAALDEAREENERLRFDAFQECKRQEPKPKPPKPLPPAEITQISLAEIVRRIEVTPPFQQHAVQQSFHNIRVVWDAFLCSASREDDDFVVMARIGDACAEACLHLFCRTTEAAAVPLKFALSESKIRINGIIYHADRMGARLSDCTFQLIPTNDG
jgi:hypothetical protein